MNTLSIAGKLNLESNHVIALREQNRDRYWLKKDPIYEQRLLWRAQSFRHLVHLLPSETILELGCGRGIFTRQLARVSRDENPITAVSFDPAVRELEEAPPTVDFFNIDSTPDDLFGRQYDYIVAMDILDENNSTWLLQTAYRLLKPGGRIVFYESNPWNPVLKMRQFFSRLIGRSDPRKLLSRTKLYELISEIGFIRLFAVHNDFVFGPLTPSLIYLLRNLSILLENTPLVQNLAGSILIHAQKPPRAVDRPKISLFRHESLEKAVSIVIPCHNEEMNVRPLVSGLKNYFDDYIHEIVLVDDNSRDKTAEVIEELAAADPRIKLVARTPPNGVGRAIADGYRAATGKYVLSMDCDFQHLLPEMRDLFEAAAEGWDVVVGSRFSRHSVLLNYPIQKIIANRAFHVLAQIFFHRPFRDLTNNLKLMRREVVENLQLTQPGFAINAETGFQPLLMDYAVKEVPISWINRTPDMGMSSFKLVKVGGGYWRVLWNLSKSTKLGFRSLRKKDDGQ